MKRLVALLLPVTLAVGCFTAVGPTNTYAKETKVETISYEIPISEEEEDYTDEQLAEICDRNDYLSVDINLDGTATITVTSKRAKELLKGELEYLKQRVQEIVDDDENEITSFRYNENAFDDFEITTNHKKMTSDEKTLVDSLMNEIKKVNGLKGNKNYNYHIVVKNAETGEVLSDSSSYSAGFSFNW